MITGAAQGMGRGHAVRLAEEGADVLAVDLGNLRRRAGRNGAAVHSLSRRAVTATAGQELGRLDAVVANAGIYNKPGPTWTITAPDWRAALDVNVTGVWHTVKAAVPHIVSGGHGR